MQKFVTTFLDDVCTLNNKTDAQKAELLKKNAEYGKVERYEDVVAQERAEYEATIQNLKTQIEDIKEFDLTQDEFAMVKAYRLAISGVVAQHKAVEDECRKTINTLEATLTQFKNKIIAVVGE